MYANTYIFSSLLLRVFDFFHNFTLYTSGLIIFMTPYPYLILDNLLVYSKFVALYFYKSFISYQIKRLASIYTCQASLPKISYQMALYLSHILDPSSQITNPIRELEIEFMSLYKRCHLLVILCILLVLKSTISYLDKQVIYRQVRPLNYVYTSNCLYIPGITYYLIKQHFEKLN